MMNLIKIHNFTTDKTRLYQIPTTDSVARGTLVDVEFADKDSTALGIAVCDSFVVDDEQFVLIRRALGIRNGVKIKSVVRTFAVDRTFVKDEVCVPTFDPEKIDAQEPSAE